MIKLSRLQKIRSKNALEKFISTDFKSKVDLFIKDLDHTISGFIIKDLKQSAKYIPELERVFKFLPQRYKARLYGIKGRIYTQSGNLKLAVKNYLYAIRCYKKLCDSENVAKTRRGLVNVYMYQGRYDDGIKTGKYALKYFRKNGMLLDAAQVMNNIGNIYHRMDKNKVALYYYNKAREVYFKKGGLPLAVIEYNRANIYANLNELDKAEELYRISADFYNKNGFKIFEAQSIYSIAYLYFLQDRYTEAMKLFEELYSTFEELGDERQANNTLLDMAEIDIHLSQYSSAATLANKIIPNFKRLGMRYEESKAHYFAADARIHLGDLLSAEKYLNQANKLFKREKNDLWLGMVNIARGKLNTAQKKYNEAARAASQAISSFNKSGDKRRKIDAELVMMKAETLAGNIESVFKISKSLENENLANYQDYNLNYQIGTCYYNQGDYERALQKFQAAIKVAEKMITGLYPDEIRFFFAFDKYECYRMAVECLLRLKRVDASFLANLHALQIINHKTDYSLREKTKIPAELIEKRNSLRAALKKLNKVGQGDQREVSTQTAYSSLEHQLWSNERKIRSLLYPKKLHGAKWNTRLEDLRAYIEPDELVINFFASHQGIGAFLADSSEIRFIELGADSQILKSYLRKLHFIFESAVFGFGAEDSGKIARKYLDHIYESLFEKLSPELDEKKLIFIADGDFAQIPFNALRDKEGDLLADKHEIRIIINPDDLRRRSHDKYKFPARRNAVFAVTSDLLPLIDLEARLIGKMFSSSNIYINEKASRKNLLSEIKKADGFVHIAAHASRASENPLFSRILLGDGPFFPFDLFQTGIHAKMAVLSGCQTAAPGLYHGNSFSLAKAFFQAGARYVLATSLPVSDKISVMFMSRFYQTLREKDDIYLSFLAAVNEIMGLTDNPAYWSSFILLGI